MAPPDLTILFNAEALEWDNYLSHYFENPTDLISTTVEHELIEEISFPIPLSRTQNFSDARAVLVILSPAFLDFLDSHAEEGYQIGKLLKPSRTVAMLCGVQENEVTSSHKAALASYDDWPHLVALDKDVNMVRNVVDAIRDLLVRSRENERMHKAQFKLVPRKVNEGNGKVFILLHKPQEENQKVRVSLEGCGVKEVPVKRRNPFTFQFMVPDSYMQTVNVVKVHVRCGDNFLGISQIKCESKMGELHNLLSSVNSPYEFLCHTLGIASLHEVDYHLAKVFCQKLPSSGLSIFNLEGTFEKRESKDEFPTLLHFAARYGLCKLTTELLKCPGAEMANSLKNVRGLIPVQLANHAGHNDTAATLEDFQRRNLELCRKDIVNQSGRSTSVVYEEMEGCVNFTEYYDIPPGNPVPVLHSLEDVEADEGKECEYLNMMGLKSSVTENLEPHEKVILGIDHLKDCNDEVLLSPAINENSPLHEKISPTDQKKITLFESQAKLIEIMEAYKKGASLTEVVTLHNEWKAKYQVSDAEAKDALDNLRNLFASNVQKPKLNKKQSLSFSEVKHYFSKLRRKDSMGIKCNSNRKMSKEINSTEKLCTDGDGTRPSSTLSIVSNTSSSSGSSFDRLSTVSGGSDSGNHSDFGDEANRNKEVSRFESRYQHNSGLNGCSSLLHLQRNQFYVSSVSSKPPPPPPRPAKPLPLPRLKISDAKSNHIYYSSSRKLSAPVLNHSSLKAFDYVLPDSYNCNSESSLTGLVTNNSISKSADNLSSLSENGSRLEEDAECHYHTPPSPRLSSDQKLNQSNKSPKANKQVLIATHKTEDQLLHGINTSSHLHECDCYEVEYDMVPPPLPVSMPPKCCNEIEYDMVPPPLPVSMPLRQSCRSPKIEDNIQFYDIPNSVSSKCLPKPNADLLSIDYDCPKSSHIMKVFPSLSRQTLSTCLSIPQSKTLVIPHTCCSGSAVYDIPVFPRKTSLPSIPSSNLPTEFKQSLVLTAESNKLIENKHSHYYNNMYFKRSDTNDSIPDEFAPPPPSLEDEEEDHYKIVGVPIPVGDKNEPNAKHSTESHSLSVYTRHS